MNLGRTWTLIISTLMLIGASACVLSSYQINMYSASRGAYEWLRGAWKNGVTAYNEEMLERLAHDAKSLRAFPGVSGAIEREAWDELEALLSRAWNHRDAGEHWVVVRGDTVRSSLKKCATPELASKLAGRDRRLAMCGDEVVLIATSDTAAGAAPRFYIASVLDHDYVDELKKLTGTEVALVDAAGHGPTTLFDTAGARLPLSVGEATLASIREETVHFESATLFVPSYHGYLMASEPMSVGASSMEVYLSSNKVDTVDGELDRRIVVIAPRVMLDQGAVYSTLILAAIAILVLGAMMIVVRFLVRRFTRPLAHLTDAAAKIGRGEREVRVGTIGGGRELETLGQAFDEMSASLAELRDNERAGAEASARRAEEIARAFAELEATHIELRDTQDKLIDASRLAGMAEVATNVLHNVGNVLNSVNVAADVAQRKLCDSKLPTLERAMALLPAEEHALRHFLLDDPRGRKLPQLLKLVTETLRAEHDTVAGELQVLNRSIDHIKNVVRHQQQMASHRGGSEIVAPSEILDMAISLQGLSQAVVAIEMVRDYQPVEAQLLDRHRTLQIVMNLLANARHAVRGVDHARIVVRLASDNGDIRVEVSDNGVGIAPELQERIFQHGFTTKSDGHGFGLHGSANAAGEMGGTLHARSSGTGCGATFVLKIPGAQRSAAA